MRRFESKPVKAMLIPDESVVNDQSAADCPRGAAAQGGRRRPAAHRVELGRLIENLRVIRSGLTSGENVIISGVQRARRPARKVTRRLARSARFHQVFRAVKTVACKCLPAPASGGGSALGTAP